MDNTKRVLIGSALATMASGLASATTIGGPGTCTTITTSSTGQQTLTCQGFSELGGTADDILNSITIKLSQTLATGSNAKIITTDNAVTGTVTAEVSLRLVSTLSGFTFSTLPISFTDQVKGINQPTNQVDFYPVSGSSTAANTNSSSFSNYLTNFDINVKNLGSLNATLSGNDFTSGLNGNFVDTASVSYNYTYVPPTTSATPEPATMALMGSALLGLGLVGKKRFRKQ